MNDVLLREAEVPQVLSFLDDALLLDSRPDALQLVLESSLEDIKLIGLLDHVLPLILTFLFSVAGFEACHINLMKVCVHVFFLYVDLSVLGRLVDIISPCF